MRVRFTKRALISLGDASVEYKDDDDPTITPGRFRQLLEIASKGIDDVGFYVSVKKRCTWRQEGYSENRWRRCCPGLPEGTRAVGLRLTRNPRGARSWQRDAYGCSEHPGDPRVEPPVSASVVMNIIPGINSWSPKRLNGIHDFNGRVSVHLSISTPWDFSKWDENLYRRERRGIVYHKHEFRNHDFKQTVIYSKPLRKKVPPEFESFESYEDEIVWAAAEAFRMGDSLRRIQAGKKKHSPLKVQMFAWERMNDWREEAGLERYPLGKGTLPAHLRPGALKARGALDEVSGNGGSRFFGLLDD